MGEVSDAGSETARMRAAACTPPSCDMLPRLKQAAVQPIEPKREPLAWEAARNAKPHSNAQLMSVE
jgi:hypothetical protein